MSRRWHPKGKGWTRTLDYGSVVAWMRPHPAGLEVVVYTGDCWGWDETRGEVWHVLCPPHSWIPRHVQDKPHRIRWLLDEHDGSVLLARYKVRGLPAHRVGGRRGSDHPRLNSRRWVNMWPPPRKIVRALGESPDQLRYRPRPDTSLFPARIEQSFAEALRLVAEEESQ
ncbi:hypothetical protein RMN56_13105 [Micromonospora halotolerans]|uniref:Uncharacterized protein n=1 Tax=Micromonospora halotolerans TaxID=709879 RepID=A0ABZ0A452_9ACTN|nr:hypothetical protein [Micromonospora halotolerans]WNM42200.1 hypothetical protein RMN56_13105 [Micromonospora halotolerans]